VLDTPKLRVPKLRPEIEPARKGPSIVFGLHWHKGWTPNREDVADLAAQTRGDITVDEYFRRADPAPAAASTRLASAKGGRRRVGGLLLT